MVLSVCLQHCESSPPFMQWLQKECQWPPTFGQANHPEPTCRHSCSDCRKSVSGRRPSAKPIILSHKPICRHHANSSHHCHLLSLSLKAHTHFIVPRRVEGWVDLGGWPHTQMVTSARKQSSSNQVRYRLTTMLNTSKVLTTALCHPTSSVKALKDLATQSTNYNTEQIILITRLLNLVTL